MKHSLIDKKAQTARFGYWPFQDRIKTTLTLVRLGNGNFDIHYSSQFIGIKIGKIDNVEIPEKGSITKRINGNPEIEVEISNCSPLRNYVAIHIKINVEVPGLGNQTIYNQTLMDHRMPSKNQEFSLTHILKNYLKEKNLKRQTTNAF
ncbi:hypothetical protein [Aquimarina longa]|uniref:hypothetical protein n=1 Tax=Aquimarina longa TaxID=1080221 RepID=UPI0007864097|nr:hypothetical protein [Aquimarina longa]